MRERINASRRPWYWRNQRVEGGAVTRPCLRDQIVFGAFECHGSHSTPVISAGAETSREISEEYLAHYTPKTYDPAFGNGDREIPARITAFSNLHEERRSRRRRRRPGGG